jgi:hypothetical protein
MVPISGARGCDPTFLIYKFRHHGHDTRPLEGRATVGQNTRPQTDRVKVFIDKHLGA